MKISAMLVPVLLATLLTAGGCEKKHDTGRKEAAPVVAIQGVTAERVKISEQQDVLEVAGTVRAGTSAVVSPRVPGMIALLQVREGDRVSKGQILARLEATENLAGAAVAVAGIEEARQGVNESLARKKLSDATFERYQVLYNEKAVTRQEFEIRQTEKELASQGVAMAEARLRQAQERSNAASAMSDYTKITAPLSGIVTSRPVALGSSVFPGQPLMTLEDEKSYRLELAIPESASGRIRPGTVVRVLLDASAAPFDSKIAEIVPTADPASRTFTAKVPLGQKNLKSGMFGRAAIETGNVVKGITLPPKGVLERGSITSVWVIDKERKARMRIVKTGRLFGDRIEILSGLSEGEDVIISGSDKVSEGVRVEE